MTSMHKQCDTCKEARASGNWAEALECPNCSGKGVVRNPQSFVCNRCGGSMVPEHADSPHGLVEQSVHGGYYSRHLFDTTTYTFSICERCLRTMFDEFKIPPKIGEYLLIDGCPTVDTGETYANDQKYYRDRTWRDAGGHIEKFKAGLCNVTVECPEYAAWRVMNSSSITFDVCCEAHRQRYADNSNYRLIPVGSLEGISGIFEQQSIEDCKRIAQAWLQVSQKPAPITVYRYVSHDVARLIDRKDLWHSENPDAVSHWMAWIPDGYQDTRVVDRGALVKRVSTIIQGPAYRLELEKTADPALAWGTLFVAPKSAIQSLLQTPTPLAALEM